MASAKQWKLRRLAPRALRIVQRRGPQLPMVEALGETVVPAATQFMTTYDQLAMLGPTRIRDVAAGRTAIADLHRTLRSWLPLAIRDIPGFDASRYCEQPTVPDDVLEEATRLVEQVRAARGPTGQLLSWAPKCLEALEPKIRETSRRWAEAEAANLEHQQLGAKTRQAATLFDEQLQLLRRTLQAAVGSRDLDYQRLRSEKVSRAEPDEEPNPPPPIAPPPEG